MSLGASRQATFFTFVKKFANDYLSKWIFEFFSWKPASSESADSSEVKDIQMDKGWSLRQDQLSAELSYLIKD